MRYVALICFMCLSGCETVSNYCRENPVPCVAAGTVIVTSIALSGRRDDHAPGRVTAIPVNCQNGVCQ